jgi:TolB-like protein
VEAPEPISKRRPSVPPALAALVMRCLEKRPADRPQTADELVRSLDTISVSGSGSAGMVQRRRIVGMPARSIALGAAALLVIAAGWWFWTTRSVRDTSGVQSIAVVPLSTASDTSDYFADGIIETVIAALTKVPGLEVRSSTSSLSLRGRHLSDAQIGELLHVGNILHVSVRRAPPRMRVIVDLARVSDGTVLWANQQERPLDEVFAAQDSIASQTARALAIHLGASDRARVSSFGTENLEAYDLYLKGRHMMTSFDEPSLHHAIALFDSAIVKDPGYSIAYSSKAECWVNLSDDWIAPRIGYANAEAAAQKAVELDSLNWGAVGMLAVAQVTRGRSVRPSVPFAVTLSARAARSPTRRCWPTAGSWIPRSSSRVVR